LGTDKNWRFFGDFGSVSIRGSWEADIRENRVLPVIESGVSMDQGRINTASKSLLNHHPAEFEISNTNLMHRHVATTNHHHHRTDNKRSHDDQINRSSHH
jgi:hypothetical protein